MGRMSQKAERQAWTDFVLGKPADAPSFNKYSNERAGKYASKHEADVAMKLWALERGGEITGLREQDRITLVPGNGALKPIIYIADFTYRDKADKLHVLDAKGFKTPIYRLKKRLAALLLGIEIEEV